MSNSTLAYGIPCPRCGVAAGVKCLNLDGSQRSRSHVNRTPVQPCGSPGGYQRHVKAGEKACEKCRDANRRYMAEYRSKNPEVREADIAGLRARHKATKVLIDRHREEFRSLLAEIQDGAA